MLKSFTQTEILAHLNQGMRRSLLLLAHWWESSCLTLAPRKDKDLGVNMPPSSWSGRIKNRARLCLNQSPKLGWVWGREEPGLLATTTELACSIA